MKKNWGKASKILKSGVKKDKEGQKDRENEK